MNRKVAKRWYVSGTVQGIGFRAFAQQKATSLGVAGWARNLDDGRVEVYAVGTHDRLDNLAAALHTGPRMAEVCGVEEKDAPLENLSGFSVH
jgi:acylphosphatase